MQTTTVATAAAMRADEIGEIPELVRSAQPGTAPSGGGGAAAMATPGGGTTVSSQGSPTLAAPRGRLWAEELIASPLNVRHSLEDCLEELPLVGGRGGKTRLEARIADRKAFARR